MDTRTFFAVALAALCGTLPACLPIVDIDESETEDETAGDEIGESDTGTSDAGGTETDMDGGTGQALPELCGGSADPGDGRRALVDAECGYLDDCWARWGETSRWSRIVPTDDIVDLPTVSEWQWGCMPKPDVDTCVEIDTHGHIGCFRFECGWSVVVVPTCAITDTDHWLDIGNGMSAWVEPY